MSKSAARYSLKLCFRLIVGGLKDHRDNDVGTLSQTRAFVARIFPPPLLVLIILCLHSSDFDMTGHDDMYRVS